MSVAYSQPQSSPYSPVSHTSQTRASHGTMGDRIVDEISFDSTLDPRNIPILSASHPVFMHPIQAKVLVGDSDNGFEKEADHIAAWMMRRPPQISGLDSSDGGSRDIQKAMMETFQTDLTGVTFHTDATAHALNQQLQSRAVTLGNDIYFRQGEYNRSSQEGQTLIAHELTHVIQQAGGTGDPSFGDRSEANPSLLTPPQIHSVPTHDTPLMQRKIGLELQSNNSAYFYREGDPKRQPTNIFDRKPIGHGNGYQVEGDAGITVGELEIQTEAVDETSAGRRKLQAIMIDIVQFLMNLDRRDTSVSEFSGGGFTLDELGHQSKLQVRLDASMGLHFYPQATVGIRLQNLETLLVALTNAPIRGERERRAPIKNGLPARVDLAQPYADQLGWIQSSQQVPFQVSQQQAHRLVEEYFHDASPALRGFMFLVSSYLHASNIPISPGFAPNGYVPVKYLMSVMSRSNLSYVYKHVLTEGDRDLLYDRTEDIPELDAPLFPSATESSFTAYTQIIEGQYGPPTFRTWLDNLGHIDLLAASDIVGYGRISAANAKYGIRNPSDIGIDETGLKKNGKEKKDKRRMDGLILELRKLGEDIHLYELEDYAMAVFDLVVATNGLVPCPSKPSKSGGLFKRSKR